jgi:hypothetical protein
MQAHLGSYFFAPGFRQKRLVPVGTPYAGAFDKLQNP